MRKAIKEGDQMVPSKDGAIGSVDRQDKLRLRAGQLGCGGRDSDDVAALIGVSYDDIEGSV